MMVGYNLYYVPVAMDQTGETWEEDPIFLHLCYGSNSAAEDAKKILEQVYGEGRICIDVVGPGIPSLDGE